MSEEDEKPASASMVSVNVTDVLGLGKATETLAPAGQKIAEAVGRLVDPFVGAFKIYSEIRAEGTANRHELKANIKQLGEIDRLLASSPELAEQMKFRLISTEMRRQANLHTTTAKALELTKQLPADAEVNDVDPDFVQEWMEGVKDVANEQVQDLWATILASAPLRKEGRISKPALTLLQQVDQSTAAMFAEYVKIWISIGPISTKRSVWKPFETLVDTELLEEIGFLRRTTFQGVEISDLGYIAQVQDWQNKLFSALNTLEVFYPSFRGMELARTVFTNGFSIPDEQILEPRKEYFSWVANDPHWALAIARNRDEFHAGTYRYVIRAKTNTDEPTGKALEALEKDGILTPLWQEVLAPYAKSGRLQIRNLPE